MPPLAYWCERPEYFAAIADAKPGYDRAIAVLRWFIVSDSSNMFPIFTFVSEHAEGSVHFQKRRAGFGKEVRDFWFIGMFIFSCIFQTFESRAWRVRCFFRLLI